MISGPVRGHVPIDPGAAQRQPNEADVEAGADSGTTFADLLAAMLAPGAPGSDLQASGSEEAVFGRLDAAEMFNETGLFRGAAPLPAQGAIPADLSVAAAVSTAPTAMSGLEAELQAPAASVDPASPAPGLATTARGAADSGRASASGAAAGAGAKASHGALPSIDGQPVVIAANPATSAAAGPEAAGGSRISSRTTAIVAQLLAARAGAAAAQVSVQAVEGGISVIARVDRLSREERERLRGEIGELLARHGYSNADIVLNGEAWPLPKGEED
ncbi:MAG TPA: hypothetical protein VF605_08675 [Allosphingosinicella sp.]|jgi:hypothetical protein